MSIIGLLVFTALVITIGTMIKFFLDKQSRAEVEQQVTAQTVDAMIKKTGFDEGSITDTKSEKDPVTGATVTTSTDAKGSTIAVTTAADGSTTTTTVKDKDGKVLDSQSASSLDTAKKLAPTLVANIAAGVVRDLVLVGGTRLVSKVTKEVSEKGVKSALQQGGKVVSRQGADMAMKFMGYVSKEAADKAATNAAEVGIRKVAKEAAEKAVADELAKNAAKYGGKKVAAEVTEKAAKEALEKVAKEAAEAAARKAVREASKKVAQTAAEKAMVRIGEQGAVKIGTKAGMAAAKMGAKAGMGPVGWALMAFDVLSMALDIACCGGYCEVADPATWTKQKNAFANEVKLMLDDSNADGEDPVRSPIITGPFDKLESAALQARLIEKARDAMADPNNVHVKAVMDKLKLVITAKTVTTEEQAAAFIDENLDMDGLLAGCTRTLCTSLLGKVIDDNGVFAGCSWPDQAKCEASFKWPIVKANENDAYSTWNKEKQECNKDPVAHNMRIICDSSGFPFDKETKICTLSREYCLKKGLKWDGTKCKLDKGQEIAEMMFGTTVVRGLNSLYSADQYENCPAGSRPAGEIAALAGIAAGPIAGAYVGAYVGQTTCASDKCPDGQDRVSGMCYEPCKTGFDDKADGITGAKVQGMCYKCPEGFKKTTAGMCQRDACDADKERGTGGGVGFCYPKCTDKFGAEYTDSNGMTTCLKKCPAGTRTEPLTCMRDVQVKRSAQEDKTCPPGWSQTTVGPAGMCQQDCTDGYKKYGGLCYHPNVNTALLLKTYEYGACPAGTRTEPATCFKDAKCVTSWNSCAYKIKGITGHRGHRGWLAVWGDVCQGAPSTDCSNPESTGRPKSCPVGYSDNGAGCTAVSKPAPQSKPLLEVGLCKNPAKPEGAGGICYQKCSDFGASFKRTGPGECRQDALSTSRDPKERGAGVPFMKVQAAEQYSRPPLGISYKVFPKKRKIPFGKGPNGC